MSNTSEYKQIWNDHIDTLNSLKWNLHQDDFNKLANITISLKALVKKADENRKIFEANKKMK